MEQKKELKTEVASGEFLEKIAQLGQQFSGFELKKASLDLELSMNGVNITARIYTV